MNEFLRRHAPIVTGVLSGFDRLLFRGTLRNMVMGTGLSLYLSVNKILFKDAGEHFRELTERVKEASLQVVERAGRPVQYLPCPSKSKEAVARQIAAGDKLDSGLICALTCVEPCQTLLIQRDRKARMQHFTWAQRKCLFIYFYYMHPDYGLMHTRLQTWAPFSINVCLNGREWLARKMDARGLGYRRADNCFLALEDERSAQRMADAQLKTDWPRMLERFAKKANPLYPGMFGAFQTQYYWTAYQTEWATDVLFKNAAALEGLYPRLIRHGITTFRSPDVLRFLGQHVTPSGRIHANFSGEVLSDLKARPEGLRMKHRVKSNSVKIYDKQGSVLRVETTINDPSAFKVYRPKEGGAEDDKRWRNMRQGVADLHRRAEVSQACNERYLTAMAKVDDEQTLGELLCGLTQPVKWKNGRVRALQPFGKDADLLDALGDASFAINGLRNADLQQRLFAHASPSKQAQRSRAAKVTRLLRMLRAHQLISKVPGTHRYQLSARGRTLVAALSAAKHANTRKLTDIAA